MVGLNKQTYIPGAMEVYRYAQAWAHTQERLEMILVIHVSLAECDVLCKHRGEKMAQWKVKAGEDL